MKEETVLPLSHCGPKFFSNGPPLNIFDCLSVFLFLPCEYFSSDRTLTDRQLWPWPVIWWPTALKYMFINIRIHFGVNLTNRRWFISQINVQINCYFDLDLWPNDLDLLFCAIIDMNPHASFGFNLTNRSWVIMENVRRWRTDGPSDRRTDGQTRL